MADSSTVFVVKKPRISVVIVALFKLRIVVLLLLAALGGPFWPPPVGPVGSRSLCCCWQARRARWRSAWNEYIERYRDSRMQRTCNRRPRRWARPSLGWR